MSIAARASRCNAADDWSGGRLVALASGPKNHMTAAPSPGMDAPLYEPTGDDVRYLGAAVIEQALQDAFGRVPRNQCRSKGRGEVWGRAQVQAEALRWFVGGTPDLDTDFAEVCELAGIDPVSTRRIILQQFTDGGVVDALTLDVMRRDSWTIGRVRQYLLARSADVNPPAD